MRNRGGTIKFGDLPGAKYICERKTNSLKATKPQFVLWRRFLLAPLSCPAESQPYHNIAIYLVQPPVRRQVARHLPPGVPPRRPDAQARRFPLNLPPVGDDQPHGGYVRRRPRQIEIDVHFVPEIYENLPRFLPRAWQKKVARNAKFTRKFEKMTRFSNASESSSRSA